MNEYGDSLRRAYASSLEQYLQTRDEVARNLAYELGRRAMVDGSGLLELARIHHEALESVALAGASSDGMDRVALAADFFCELLSPFEMSLSGYREANEELQRANRSLAKQKEAVELANRELESFSYSVSHDLRAPLRRIDGFSQILLEDFAGALDEVGKRHLRRVREGAKHMGQLIEDLLSLAQVSRAELHRSDVDLTALAGRIADRLVADSGGRRGTFAIADGIRARCDARLVGIVLENLLGNAWKFTSKNDAPEIEFGRREPRDGPPQYFVRDNGAGFDMAHASGLFGAFQRLHPTSEFEGTGIGLATVQRIVQRHGGRIWAESKVDEGATFYFTLDGEGP